jgi:hypothetical protein
VKAGALGALSSALSQGLTLSIRSAHSHLHLCKLSPRDKPLPAKRAEGVVPTIGPHSASIPGFGHPVRQICVPLFALLSIGVATIAAADPVIHIELNAAETVQQDHCRLSFVVQNNAESAIDTLKLDLALFDREGTISRRMIVEIGPFARPRRSCELSVSKPIVGTSAQFCSTT